MDTDYESEAGDDGNEIPPPDSVAIEDTEAGEDDTNNVFPPVSLADMTPRQVQF